MHTKQLSPVFESNPNKDFLRSSYDKTLVKEWFNFKGKSLKYLGLPAWEMLDIIEWQEFLDRFSTIEREENQQHLMFLTANVKDVEHRLHSMYGEFDELLLTGRDKYGKRPDWPYDIINLDYFGGFIYSNMSRPKALIKLIENQGIFEDSFLLIVTQHLRDGDSTGEKASFLEDLRRSLKNSTYDSTLHVGIDRVIDWYLNSEIPDAARQALYMNFFFRDYGEAHHFNVECRPAVIYAGTGGTWMIHFVTSFRYKPGIGHRAASDQSLIELINLGLREVRDGHFTPTRFIQPTLRPET
jgi:hypothetical protein